MYAVLVHVNACTLSFCVPGIEAGHHMHPCSSCQLVLKIRAGAETTLRVEEVGRDAVGPILRRAAVEAQGPLLPLWFALAQPNNVWVVGLSLECEHIGPNPDLNRQPLTTRRLAEIFVVGNLDIGAFPVQLDSGVRITLDCTALVEGGRTMTGASVPVRGAVQGIRTLGLPQPPVCDRLLRQHHLLVV